MVNGKKLIFYFLAVCFVYCASATAIQAATIHANSASYADVSAAVFSASAGDTVMIPTGNVTWSSGITINKALTLQGSGYDSTIINCTGTTTLVNIAPSSDVPVRVREIQFKFSSNAPGGHAIYISGKRNGTFPLTKVRIDHNKFEKGSRSVFATGWVEGVIDNNEFLNCNIAIGIQGDGPYAWSRPIEAGTAKALFIEDNTFIQNDNPGRELNEVFYHQEGARTVIRYNTIDASTYPYQFAPFDTHGNQDLLKNGFRGQPIIEVHNNTWIGTKSYRILYIRGGSNIIYNNTFTMTGSASCIALTEEEGWQTAFFSPLRSAWSAWDQVNNSFFWNNKLNGNTVNPFLSHTSDDTFIQLNRDYFDHAPESSGGYESWSGDAGSSALIWNASGANAYYPYAPYTYPHPLRAENTIRPPTNVKIVK